MISDENISNKTKAKESINESILNSNTATSNKESATSTVNSK